MFFAALSLSLFFVNPFSSSRVHKSSAADGGHKETLESEGRGCAQESDASQVSESAA